MSTNTITSEAAGLPASLQPFTAELEAFYQALPQLLDEGHQDRYVVIRGNVLHSIWDTGRDASQYGHEKFDDGRFLRQKIDSRLLPVLKNLFAQSTRESA